MRLAIVMYHYVRDLQNSRYPNIKGLPLKNFCEQVEFLMAHFTCVSCEQVKAAIYAGHPLPENACLLTFDDGYIDHYTNVFPVLQNKHIPAFFSMPARIIAESKMLDVNKIHFILAAAHEDVIFKALLDELTYYRGDEFPLQCNEELIKQYAVPSRFDGEKTVFIKQILQKVLDERLRIIIADKLFSKFVCIPEYVFAKELYMSFEQIKLMKNSGMDFGLHGYDHYWLGSLTAEHARNDIQKALDVFSGIIDNKDWTMCFPYGSFNADVISFCKSKNCTLGFSTKVGFCDLQQHDPFELPRFDTNDFPPQSTNYVQYA